MVIYLFNCPMDSSAKLTWMFIIAILPLAGAAFLLFTQSNVGHRMERKLVDQQIQQSKEVLEQPENVLEAVEHDGSGTDDLCRYLNRSGHFPLYEHTRVTYFPLGEDKFEAMLEQLEKAEKYIFLEYFIIEEGYMWGRILDILTRKAREGVEVRVLYDGMCEMSTLPVDYWKLLNAEGIKAKPFSPIKPVISSHYNYRDHRKILVIDGKVAFNGGVNLADEYINRVERFGRCPAGADGVLRHIGRAAVRDRGSLRLAPLSDEDDPAVLRVQGRGSDRVPSPGKAEARTHRPGDRSLAPGDRRRFRSRDAPV